MFPLKLILILINLLLFSLPVVSAYEFHPAPPHPLLEEKIRRGEIPVPHIFEISKELIQRGVNKPSKKFDFSRIRPKGTIFAADKISYQSSSFNVLVILINFSDNSNQTQPEFFDSLIFNESAGSNSVRVYYRETSYGKLDMVTVNLPSSTDWLLAPQPYSYYTNGAYGIGSYPKNTQKLVEWLIDEIDPYVNFSDYNNDGDLNVEGISIIHAGPGAEVTGNVNDIWSHQWGISSRLRDGVYITDYTIQPEYVISPGDTTIGVFAHEFGHLLGLPDLYDIDLSSHGIGKWSLMAAGAWNGPNPGGSSPAHLDPWSKIYLGFTNPQIPSTPGNYVLQNSEFDDSSIYRLWSDNNLTSSEYFLIENRQQIGFDSFLPGSGLLIWHIDDTKSTNSQEWYPGNTISGHYKVALEQADGLWDLEQYIDNGDPGDPYPGITNNLEFTSTTTPDSKSYAGFETNVSVENIPLSGNNMSVFLSTSANIVICRDVDGNNKVNIIDVVLIIFAQGRSSIDSDWINYNHLDRNNDGSINLADILETVGQIGQSC